MDGYAASASVITGILILVSLARNKWFNSIDEERDGDLVAFSLLALTVVGTVAVIAVASIGPHFSY